MEKTRAEQYRSRAALIAKKLKRRLSAEDRAKFLQKRSALEALAEAEDWLEGKTGSQLTPPERP
jgi:hypothetical protein